jgi:hypothetical protein
MSGKYSQEILPASVYLSIVNMVEGGASQQQIQVKGRDTMHSLCKKQELTGNYQWKIS